VTKRLRPYTRPAEDIRDPESLLQSRHTLKIEGDESGQIGEGDHHEQGHSRTSDAATG
jgi:hypothetical protein